jgi:hypothetical protein
VLPNFKRFDRTTAPITTEPFLTVHKGWKTVAINHAAYLLLEEPETVELLFDETEQIMGLHKVPPSEPYAFPVRKQGNARNYLVAAQAFAKHYSLQTDEARRYPAELLEGGVLAVDLKEGGIVATGPATGPRTRSRATAE